MTEATLQGPWRRPTNTSADAVGGIHHDETAQALGFEGGTVAGSIHMEQFPPFLCAHLGDDWLQTGSLSLYFRHATLHGDPVRCLGEAPEEVDGRTRMRIAMENEPGDLVMDGDASLGGPDPDSALRRRLREVRPANDVRVLADVECGRWCAPIPVQIAEADIDRQLAVVTEPMPMFGSPGDAARVPPLSSLIHVMRRVESEIALTRGDFVGLFGAIEIAYSGGQPCTGEHYTVEGQAIAVSESPRTEIFWMESVLRDAANGAERVRMIKMDRIMKDSSPLWRS